MTGKPTDWPPLDPRIVHAGAIPIDALFLDTNAVFKRAVLSQRDRRSLLISSVVYAELLRNLPRGVTVSGHATTLDQALSEKKINVIAFDGESARSFLDLCVRLRFDGPPLSRPGEDKRRCFDRLRFDLLIFAAALRHRRLLVTDNHTEFRHFPFPETWATSARLAEQPDLRAPAS